MKHLLITILIFYISALLPSAAQEDLSAKELKQLKKVAKLVEKEKYDKAIDKVSPLINNNPQNGQLWEVMMDLKWKRYEVAKQQEQDELMEGLLKALDSNKKNKNVVINLSFDSKSYLNSFISSCIEATLCNNNLLVASIYIRTMLVEAPVDTAVSEEAKEAFDLGEEQFKKRNFHNAVKHYMEALKIDSNYYKATLYIGDSYWNDEQPELSLKYLKKAIDMQPDLLEPRKYLVDAYIDMGTYDYALEQCIEGIAIYPDINMFQKLNLIANRLGKSFDQHWMYRKYYPNQMAIDEQSVAEGPWKYYRKAKANIAPFCDENGVIIKENDLTKQKYMESYCWEYMLKHSDGEEFDFARKMLDAGHLDSFVFISLYHYSVNDQFQHFSEHNKDKIREYINKYLLS